MRAIQVVEHLSMSAKVADRSYIDPDRLYTLTGFRVASGIAQTRMREARLQGVIPRQLKVGKRIFIRGRDAIEYVERLAELPSQHSD
jgi:hypothetical protein